MVHLENEAVADFLLPASGAVQLALDLFGESDELGGRIMDFSARHRMIGDILKNGQIAAESLLQPLPLSGTILTRLCENLILDDEFGVFS